MITHLEKPYAAGTPDEVCNLHLLTDFKDLVNSKNLFGWSPAIRLVRSYQLYIDCAIKNHEEESQDNGKKNDAAAMIQ
jgi:hypothetical protein